MTHPVAPPGWYPDPTGGGGQKYWDGALWHDAIPTRPGVQTAAKAGMSRNAKIGWGVAAVLVAGIAVGNVIATSDDKKPSESAAAERPNSATATATPNVAAIERMESAYLDTAAADRAYWDRAVQLLSEQDDATLDPTGDVSITMSHGGETASLYRNDLGSIAYNVCFGLAQGDDAAETVGWIKDTFDVPRRWEAGQLRAAAIETKCPTLR